MHPWQTISELAQFRNWLRANLQGLVDSISATANVEPAIVLEVLDALHCQAMGGQSAGDPCLLGRANAPG